MIAIKRRIKKLELHKEDKDIKILIVKKQENGLFEDKEGFTYTDEQLEKVSEEMQVLKIVWGK